MAKSSTSFTKGSKAAAALARMGAKKGVASRKRLYTRRKTAEEKAIIKAREDIVEATAELSILDAAQWAAAERSRLNGGAGTLAAYLMDMDKDTFDKWFLAKTIPARQEIHKKQLTAVYVVTGLPGDVVEPSQRGPGMGTILMGDEPGRMAANAGPDVDDAPGGAGSPGAPAPTGLRSRGPARGPAGDGTSRTGDPGDPRRIERLRAESPGELPGGHPSAG